MRCIGAVDGESGEDRIEETFMFLVSLLKQL